MIYKFSQLSKLTSTITLQG